MRYYNCTAIALATAIGAFPASYAGAQDFSANLNGFNETPSILSDGTGTFTLNLVRNGENSGTATYTLTYSGLSSPATQGHIHLSKVHVAGGIIVWLCGTASLPGPAGTPTCPAGGGTVTGTIKPSSVVAIAAQLVPAGDFEALVDALRTNSAYANVHTTNAPAGEIRGQIRGQDE
jgi:hypothetical protein